MSSVSLRPIFSAFAFDPETGTRRPRGVVVVAALVALLLAAVGVFAGVSAATAHTPKVTVDCYGVTVELKWYDGAGDNSLRVVYGDQVHEVADFGTDLPSTTFAFANPALANSWSVTVVAHDDDGDNGWNVDQSGTTTPCDAPGIDLTATECHTVDGSTTVTATFSKLLNGQTYTAQLYKNDLPEGAAFIPSTVTPSVWPNMDAGVTYAVTVTSDQHPGLTTTVTARVVGCPQNSHLKVVVTECTSPTSSNAGVQVTASQLVPHRTYAAVVWQNGSPLTGDIPVNPGTNTSVAFTIPVPPSTSGMTVVLTDIGAGTQVTSTGFATTPCPSDPAKPVVETETCTEVGGTLELTVTLDGLTANRAYLVQIDGVQVDEFTATGTSQGGLVYAVAAGTHTVTVVDKAVPSIATSSDPIEVSDCPTQPQVALALTECLAAGGTGDVTATFSGLGVGRSYSVTITQDGNAVAGYETPVTVTSASAPLTFAALAPGFGYTVTIVDLAVTAVKDADSVFLDACPMTPGLTLSLECLFIEGESLITVMIEKLVPGEDYTVSIVGGTTSTRTTVTGGATPAAIAFQVPNDVHYTVTVTQVANPLVTSSATVFATICDLPTFPLPPELPQLPTLALTGPADLTMPMLGALGLVQVGVALLALAAMVQFTPTRMTPTRRRV